MVIKSIKPDDQTGAGHVLVELHDGRPSQIKLSFLDVDRGEYLWPSSDRPQWSKVVHYFTAAQIEDASAKYRIGPEVCNWLQSDSVIEISSSDGLIDKEVVVWEGVPILASEKPVDEATRSKRLELPAEPNTSAGVTSGLVRILPELTTENESVGAPLCQIETARPHGEPEATNGGDAAVQRVPPNVETTFQREVPSSGRSATKLRIIIASYYATGAFIAVLSTGFIILRTIGS